MLKPPSKPRERRQKRFSLRAASRTLEPLKPQFQSFELGEGFVSIDIADGVNLYIERDALEIRLLVKFGPLHVTDEPCKNPLPEDLVEPFEKIIRLTPSLTALGFERVNWGSDEDGGYEIIFKKNTDTSDADVLRSEVSAVVNFFGAGLN